MQPTHVPLSVTAVMIGAPDGSRALGNIKPHCGRSRRDMKRGGDVSALDLDEALAAAKEPNTDLAAIDDALTALGAVDARKGQVVEMRFFGGMRVEESAEVLKISSET